MIHARAAIHPSHAISCNLMQSHGAIFDLDGTLVDSCDAHERAWKSLGESVGIPVSHDFFMRFFGRQNTPIIQALFAEGGCAAPDSQTIAALAIRKEDSFRALIAHDFPIMPGTLPLLAALRGSSWRLAIGSSAPQVNVDFMLGALARAASTTTPFDAIVTGNCVERGKPHPDVFLEAARRLNLPATACVVIEDAAPGIEAAHRAGMKCVALCSAGHTTTELAAADLLIHHLDELTPSRLQSLITP